MCEADVRNNRIQRIAWAFRRWLTCWRHHLFVLCTATALAPAVNADGLGTAFYYDRSSCAPLVLFSGTTTALSNARADAVSPSLWIVARRGAGSIAREYALFFGNALLAARAITAETSVLARASEAAFRAAGRADGFALGAKHASGAGGGWAKFAEGVNPNAALREALSVPGARILPNDANSFRVVTDLAQSAPEERPEFGRSWSSMGK